MLSGSNRSYTFTTVQESLRCAIFRESIGADLNGIPGFAVGVG
jgi:hypothetical protein